MPSRGEIERPVVPWHCTMAEGSSSKVCRKEVVNPKPEILEKSKSFDDVYLARCLEQLSDGLEVIII